MSPTSRLMLSATLLAAVAACGEALDADPADSIAAGFVAELSITAVEASAVCAAVNHPSTRVVTLDRVAGLHASSARAIIEHRDGDDRAYPTHDDDAFDDLHELDAVDFVGPVALEQLRAWAQAVGQTRPETVEGVTFLGAEAVAVVWGVNRASRKELDATVALDRRAADQLVALRPFASVAAIGRAPYVGPSALMQLRTFAADWADEKAAVDAESLAGIYLGIDYDESTAFAALAIGNGASVEELAGEAALPVEVAEELVDGRPYADLLTVVALDSMRAGVMQALHDYAASGVWSGLTCDPSFTPLASGPTGAYAAALASFDPRGVVARYALSAWEAATCIRRGTPEIEIALHEQLVGMTAWPDDALSDGASLVATPLTPGADGFLRLLDRSLATMAEARDARIADGDAAAETAYRKIADLHIELHVLVQQHPEAVYSLTMQRSDGDLSEEAALLVDFDSSLVLAIHQRPGN